MSFKSLKKIGGIAVLATLSLGFNNYAGASSAEPVIGDVVNDGSIYVGLNPETGYRAYTTPQDAFSLFSAKNGEEYCLALRAHGHDDWRVPSQPLLNTMYEVRDKGALAKTFNETGSPTSGWYWSSTADIKPLAKRRLDAVPKMWMARMEDGDTAKSHGNSPHSIRCVREDTPRP